MDPEDKIDNFRFEWDRLVADEYNDTVKNIMNTKVSICVARPHKPSDCENITDEYVTQWKQDQLITDKLFYYNPFGPNAPTAVLREHLKAQCRRDMKMYERYKDDFKTYANKTTRRQYDEEDDDDWWLPTGTAEDRDDLFLAQDDPFLEQDIMKNDGLTDGPQMFDEKGVITNEETPRAESSFGSFGW